MSDSSSSSSSSPSQGGESDSLLTILNTLSFPLKFMFLSSTFLPGTLLTSPLSDLYPLSRLKSAWFSRFWSHVGPLVRESASPSVIPLLSGRIRQGRLLLADTSADHHHNHHPPISGLTLELGPGSGQWLPLLSSFPSITRIYGVEPNVGIHPLLRSQIARCNLEDKYTIVPVGIESLASSGKVQRGSLDSIMTVLCLCSIPDPERNIKELYTYLKPGGRWYVYEHVKTFPDAPRWLRWYQCKLITLPPPPPFFFKNKREY